MSKSDLSLQTGCCPRRRGPRKGWSTGHAPHAGQLGGPASRGLRVSPGVHLRRPPVTTSMCVPGRPPP
eukprot:256645-Prorocentrum_minimum.AAC.1